METINNKMGIFWDMALQYAPKLVLAIVVLIVGLWIIKRLVNMLGKAMNNAKLDKDIQPFLQSLLSVILKVMLVFSVAGIVGIETTSFVAVLAAAGFAVGMALQGSLSNFASGVMILIFKPYKVGDLITVQGVTGVVEEIQIFNTMLLTGDHKKVIMPNSQSISGAITNLSEKKFLRVDLKVPVSYEIPFEKVEKVALQVLHNHPKVLKDPAPFVGIESYDSHNVMIAIRPHANTDDYWTVYFDCYRDIKKTFAENNITLNYTEGTTTGKIG